MFICISYYFHICSYFMSIPIHTAMSLFKKLSLRHFPVFFVKADSGPDRGRSHFLEIFDSPEADSHTVAPRVSPRPPFCETFDPPEA